MSSSNYISLPITTDATDISTTAFLQLQNTFPGWRPMEGQLETLMIEVFSRLEAETRDVQVLVAAAIFRYFGKSIMSIPAVDGAAAQLQSTWTTNDASGYVIPAGTLVVYQPSSYVQQYLTVQSDVTVDVGSYSTADGEVVLVSTGLGAVGNGIPAGAALQIVDALAFVNTITSTTVSSGGVDAESDAAYLSRLHDDLKLLSREPILPSDFAELARSIAGVDRALAVDGYNPADGTYNNERMIAVALADVDGQAVPSAVALAVKTYLDSMREVNFVVSTINPTYTQIDVTATLKIAAGYDAATVQNNATAAVTAYLDPAAWDWSPIVRRFELVSLLSNIAGVHYVDSLSSPDSDVILAGIAALVTPGSIQIAVLQ